MFSDNAKVAEEGAAAFKEIKGAWMQNLFEDSLSDEGVIIAQKARRKFKAMGTKTLSELYSPREFGEIMEAFKGAQLLQKTTEAGKAGGLAGTFLFVGAATKALELKSRAVGKLVTLTIGARHFGNFMNSKIGREWLTIGWKLPVNEPATANLIIRTIREGLESGWLTQDDISMPEGQPLTSKPKPSHL